MFEVEVKAKVENLDYIKNRLIEKNARFLVTENQKDNVYGFKHDFPPKDRGIIARIRKKNSRIVLEFKEVNRGKGSVELKNEINEIEPYHNFLTKLNFHKFFEMHKTRNKYEFRGFTICLDDIQELGTYIEIEKLIDSEQLKQATMQECRKILEEIAPNAEFTKEKYGDMMCRKLNITRKTDE